MQYRLSLKRLEVIEACLNVPLAGDIGEGDFQSLNEQDLLGALAWVQQEIEKRESAQS